MSTVKHIDIHHAGQHGLVAIGAAAGFAAALFVAKLAADGVVYLGSFLLH